MANLLIFIHDGAIWKSTIQPQLKNGTHFSCYESLPKGCNVQMSNCLSLTWDATSRNGQQQVRWPKWKATLSPWKIGSPVQIAFWWFLFVVEKNGKLNLYKVATSIKQPQPPFGHLTESSPIVVTSIKQPLHLVWPHFKNNDEEKYSLR